MAFTDRTVLNSRLITAITTLLPGMSHVLEHKYSGVGCWGVTK